MRSPLLMVAAMLLLQACIPLDTPGASGNNIFVLNNNYSPIVDSLIAASNDTVFVTFRWGDSSVGHSVTWDSVVPPGPGPLPDDVQVTSDGNYGFHLASGTYYYHCAVHETTYGMVGQIVILPFGTYLNSRRLASHHAVPAPALVTRPSPGAAQGSPRRAGRRSQPATS